jgi:AcrR family transcriptional regulator
MARKSAEVRREEIVGIALRHFAEGGYHGTSTEAIAREAGISQPYLFRLFRTKRELFLACVDRCFGRVTAVFREAAEAAPEGERKTAMGDAYETVLLPDRHMLLFQMQAYAISEPEIRVHVREGFRELVRTIAALAEFTPDETWDFFAYGMLMNVTTALDLPREGWE